ncbi:glutamine--fructose-6-phosphate aminotransferase [Haloprofundus marisrubri]|uniref:Glutamine--fructose-6-phosphate aminotransferase [isomerizing] n=1 Tax=Haloprofundus marisrubri TaxID=1514971 RepID=A0A0W1R6W8_9EURY|nr:glutamine--fructose-6-phosphate transaminase (isomerizing) [Haloprofundus marisrubri]KTG08960.1 glutamine--fructose-6-phosphate aminotransferase [Haloprofundus marisrubri]
MCGIIGCVGRGDETLDVLVEGLSKLEYRGYDSAGVALSDGQIDVNVVKRAGELDALREALSEQSVSGRVGIGHTRWSTHGPPTDENAHPHTDCTGSVAVVHNGIIENYDDLREELETSGHEFRSDTDTEVVPHLVEEKLAAGAPPEAAFRAAVERLSGSFALVCVVASEEAVFAARQDSPLVLGVGDDSYYLGSDVPAFLAHTDRVVYLDDGEFATLRPSGWTVRNGDDERVEKSVETVDWNVEDTGKSGYDHYMLKEIHEQPRALRQCLSGRVDERRGEVTLSELEGLETPSAVHLVACGTSYHAALYGVQLFHSLGIPAQAFLASEYATGVPPLGDSLVVGITQSGETADTLSALREARARGARTLAVTNVVGSTAARECDYALYIRAGPEIGVAATKTFSSQLVSLNLLVEYLAGDQRSSEERRAVLQTLRDLPGRVQQVLDESMAEEVAAEYLGADGYFFIGRGLNYPVALEGALKFKEITYEHAEGFAAGELKHGTLALVTENTPVFAVVTGEDAPAKKTLGNVREVESRGAPVIAVTDDDQIERYADASLRVPSGSARVAPVLVNVQLQLVAYWVANALGRSIDKPRNLAKSVTVE